MIAQPLKRGKIMPESDSSRPWVSQELVVFYEEYAACYPQLAPLEFEDEISKALAQHECFMDHGSGLIYHIYLLKLFWRPSPHLFTSCCNRSEVSAVNEGYDTACSSVGVLLLMTLHYYPRLL